MGFPRALASRGTVGISGLVAISLLVLAYAAVSRRLSGSVVTGAMGVVAGGILVTHWWAAGLWRKHRDVEDVRPETTS